MKELESLGYKVLLFTPEVIADVDQKVLETALVEAYWSVLEDIGKDEAEAEKCAKES